MKYGIETKNYMIFFQVNVSESGNTISGTYEFIDKKGTVSIEFGSSGVVQVSFI